MERKGSLLSRRQFLHKSLLAAGVAITGLSLGDLIGDLMDIPPGFNGSNPTFLNYGLMDRPTVLEQSLTTRSRSDKVGLVNENIFKKDEKQTVLGNSIFAFNPLAPTTWIPHGYNRNELIQVPVFANDPNYGHFRQDRGTILDVYNRSMEALQAGKKLYVVFSILGIDEQKIAEGANLLIKNGITNFIIGNEPNVEDAGKAEGNKVENVLKAAQVINDEAEKLGVQVNLSPPGLAHYGDGEYLEELVSKAGINYPFVGVNDHYYGSSREFSSRILMMRRKMEDLRIKGPYRVTEIGNPVEFYKEDIPNEDLTKGGIILRLLAGVSVDAVDEIYWYCALDWGKPEHSLTRVENNRLIPNDSYIAFRIAGRLANGIVESEIDDSRTGVLAVHAKRLDGINFTVIAAIGERAVDLPLQPWDSVFNTKGEPTGERGLLRLTPPTIYGLNGEERIIIHT